MELHDVGRAASHLAADLNLPPYLCLLSGAESHVLGHHLDPRPPVDTLVDYAKPPSVCIDDIFG